MSISIKRKIYVSFSLLVFLFVLNGMVTIYTLYQNKKLSGHISAVVDPSLQTLNDFRHMMLESKMYSTNWVFLRYNQNDKEALLRLHDKDYKNLKSSLAGLSSCWKKKEWVDSLNKVFTNFEDLLITEKRITGLLRKFKDYDDPVIKLEAEHIVEDEVIPGTAALTASLEKIIGHEQDTRIEETKSLELSSASLRAFICFFAITIICLGAFLSIYFSRVIIKPLQTIKHIVNDLGKGITSQIQLAPDKGDEIGEMISSINSLSQKLRRTATFAYAIGLRNFDIPFKPLSDEDTLGKALVAMRDNLKQTDAQLNEAQHLAHLGSWERNHVTEKISWSDEMFNIFEIERGTIGYNMESLFPLIHPDDLQFIKERVSRKPAEDVQSAYECRIITPKGRVKTIYIEDKIFVDCHGKVLKVTGIMQDITERRKSSIALEEALAQLKQLFESIDQAFFSVDIANQKVLQLSSACERIYGYPAQAFFDSYHLWKGLVYHEDLYKITRGMETMAAGFPASEEYRIVHRDKSLRWVEARFSPTLDSSGRLVRIDGMVNDISKRKTAELERDMITADLIERNKDLQQFTYIVSHNLRAPVTNIMALSHLLHLTAASPNKEYEQLLNGLTVSINKLDTIILDLNQILTVRTPGYEKKETVSLLSVVQDISASIKHILDKEDAVINCNFSQVENVFALRSYMYSIFYNLILNSIKYKQSSASPVIHIQSSRHQGKTCISFADNGKGIDMQKHGKDIFKLYKRFDTSVEGKGIGLYMVKTAIETLGGKISLQSEVNNGVEFRIEFPSKPDDVVTSPHDGRAKKVCDKVLI